MKKTVTGIFAAALGVALLFWGYDAIGSVGHGRAGHHDADPAAAGHEAADDLFDDPADADVARAGLSRRALDRVELTGDQREKIDALRSAYTRDIIRLRADSRLARVDLRELMNETSPDISRVRELAAAVSRAQGDVFERSTVFRAEMKNLLTPEQQQTLRESFRDRRDRRRDSGMRWQRSGRESRGRR